jgi:hypothetical protein
VLAQLGGQAMGAAWDDRRAERAAAAGERPVGRRRRLTSD